MGKVTDTWQGAFFFLFSSQRLFSLLKNENTSRKPVMKSLKEATSGNNYLSLLLYPSNTMHELWRNLMTLETPESGMGLVQSLLEKEHRGKDVGKAQNWGKAFSWKSWNPSTSLEAESTNPLLSEAKVTHLLVSSDSWVQHLLPAVCHCWILLLLLW